MTGDLIPKKIIEGISNANHLIYIISSSSVRSKWVEEELNIAKVKEKESNGLKILPLLIEDIELPVYVKHIRCADFRNWRNPDSYRLSFLEILRAMHVEPRLLGSEELKWYARNRRDLRELSRSFKSIDDQLFGTLTSAQSMDKRDEPTHYLITKWAFHDWCVISLLERLLSIIGEFGESAHPPRIKSLRDSAVNAMEYGQRELLYRRTAYEDFTKADDFRKKLGVVASIFNDIEEELEIVVFASVGSE